MQDKTQTGDYALLDCGNGRKLERFGDWCVDRPAPQAGQVPRLANWQADWVYSGSRVGEGRWQASREGLPVQWTVQMHGQAMQVRLGQGGQVGIYPEHAICWDWLRERLAGCDHIDELRVLNLFAGTGGASLAAAQMGASVVHVDAQSSQIELAQLNLVGHAVKFIRDDVMTYVQRLLRRGDRFHMIIADPPSFGRGGNNKAWDIRTDLQPLIASLPQLLAQDSRGVWLSLHTRDMTAQGLADLLGQVLPGKVRALQLGVTTAQGVTLDSGVAATWHENN